MMIKTMLIGSLLAAVALAVKPASAADSAVDDLLGQYRAAGATSFDKSAGAALWQKDFDGKSCTSCHGADLTQPGKHKKTGKSIKPMAASLNPERLTDSSKIEKWFLRNCKWTLGRECTAQEKGDVLIWLREQ